jgi:excisionase family DNA binding protein
VTEPRLVVPTAAAVYLGLRSRWAIYRLVAAGELPAVRLAGKLLLDLRDLDALIETRKVTAGVAVARSAARPTVGRPRVLTELTPLRPARHGDGSVTAGAKPRAVTARERRPLHIQSGAPASGGTA